MFKWGVLLISKQYPDSLFIVNENESLICCIIQNATVCQTQTEITFPINGIPNCEFATLSDWENLTAVGWPYWANSMRSRSGKQGIYGQAQINVPPTAAPPPGVFDLGKSTKPSKSAPSLQIHNKAVAATLIKDNVLKPPPSPPSPQNSPLALIKLQADCKHQFVDYVGFTKVYKFCIHCDAKKAI